MKGFNLRLVFAISFAILLQGCGGGSDVPGNITSGAQPLELEGSWRKACGRADISDPSSHYDIVTVTFSGNLLFSDIENYEDAACVIPQSFSPNPTASGTFVIGTEVTLSDGTQATEIDSHVDTFNGAPFQIDEYGIYRIEVDILYVEDDSGLNDGTTPALRPNSLDYNRPFIRQ
ncbi:MAG: hypothetical protein KZQ77_00205 [Candidatus Thiodiazotropha sp. (ex Notomyrtea botanica)]|nr:hypothetical protein [Candidatus Thiodiazotropha sp. (ex Notomyrtea botanica)]